MWVGSHLEHERSIFNQFIYINDTAVAEIYYITPSFYAQTFD